MLELELLHFNNRNIIDEFRRHHDKMISENMYFEISGPHELSLYTYGLKKGVYTPTGFLKLPLSGQFCADEARDNNGFYHIFTPLADSYFRKENVKMLWNGDSMSSLTSHCGIWPDNNYEMIETWADNSVDGLIQHVNNYFEKILEISQKLNDDRCKKSYNLLKSVYATF